MNYDLKTIETKVSEFDKMKFIDEDGKEKISERDLAKALGYSKFENFQKAIKSTNDQIINSGNLDVLPEVRKHIKVKMPNGGEADRIISDYHLTRKQAINVANNCDTSKPEVALV